MVRKYTVTVEMGEPAIVNVLDLAGILTQFDVPLAQVEQAMDLPVGESMQVGSLFIARVEEI